MSEILLLKNLPADFVEISSDFGICAAAICAKRITVGGEPVSVADATTKTAQILDSVLVHDNVSVLPEFFSDIDRLPAIGVSLQQKDIAQQLGLMTAKTGYEIADALRKNPQVEEVKKVILRECTAVAASYFAAANNRSKKTIDQIGILIRGLMIEVLMSSDPGTEVKKTLKVMMKYKKEKVQPEEFRGLKTGRATRFIVECLCMGLEVTKARMDLERKWTMHVGQGKRPSPPRPNGFRGHRHHLRRQY